MPTVEENLSSWNSTYSWDNRGDEWSTSWGSPEAQWYGSLFPRIHRFVPAGTILEIAPGYGRWTHYLKDLAERLIIVDLSDKCIDYCKQRFAHESHIEYFINDGKTLDMIEDRSIDFVFSFDSLVHADPAVIQAYLRQLTVKLTLNGAGFIHHSNLGTYNLYMRLYSAAGRVPGLQRVLGEQGLIGGNAHWRDGSMTASLFARMATDAGLECVGQEVVNWGEPRLLNDAFSMFTLRGSKHSQQNRLVKNRGFQREVEYIAGLSPLYCSSRSGTI